MNEQRTYVTPRELAKHPVLASLDAEIAPRRAVADVAYDHVDLAFDALKALCRFAETDGGRLGAAREILDRAYGKPVQAVAGQFDGKLTISWMMPGDDARVIEH